MIDCRWIASFHEAAHATAAVALGEPVFSIRAFDDGSGEFRATPPTFEPPNWDQHRAVEAICAGWREAGGPQDMRWLEHKCVVLLAGPAATRDLVGDEIANQGATTDFFQVRSLLAALPIVERRRGVSFEFANEYALRLVRRNWPAIRALATVAYCADAAVLEPTIREALRVAGPHDVGAEILTR